MSIREGINIRYELVGRVDGRWVIQAFDRNDRKLGAMVTVNTPNEAWKVWMLLNGYGTGETEEITQVTKREVA